MPSLFRIEIKEPNLEDGNMEDINFNQDVETMMVEDIDNLQASFACFDDHTFYFPDISMSVVRNIGKELAALDDDESSKIRTFLRIRPPTKNGNVDSFDSQLYSVEDGKILQIQGNKFTKKSNPYADETKFKFSKIFGQDCTQSTVFEECVQPILDKLFAGDNCLIFSYGGTNSGKTYTMQGYGTEFGIVPRTLDQVFNLLEDRLYTLGNIKPNLFNAVQILSEVETKALEEAKQRVLKEVRHKGPEMNSFRASFGVSSAASTSSGSSGSICDKIIHISSVPLTSSQQYPSHTDLYAVWVNFVEIYNERVYDLFEQPQKGKKRKELKLLADKEGRVYVKDVTELSANSAEEAYQLFLAGKANLQFAATHANQNSSRSHSFFNIRLVAVGVAEKTAYPKRVFQMSFCDLAGIERVSQTGNVGVRLKESGNINQSLLVLLKCIRAMRDQQQSKTSPDCLSFRESKLARLFQSHLTSTTHTRMIVNINPDPEMFESTFHVLQNSAIASEVITYRRVEPPVSDTAFARGVRASIGLVNRIKYQMEETFEETIDESMEDFNATTVVATCKIPWESMKDKVARLEIENSMLRQEKRSIEDRVRTEMSASFAAIMQDDGECQRKWAKEMEAVRTNLNARRVSIAIHMMNPTKGVGTTPGNLAISPETSSPSELFCTPPNKPINFRKEWKQEQEKSRVLSQRIEELNEIIACLQRSLCDRITNIARLEAEKKDKESLIDSRLADIQHLLEFKEEELNRLKLEDPSKSEDMKQMQKLLEELQKLNEAVVSKDAELQDAKTACLDYHEKLEEANYIISQMSTDYHKLHKEHQGLVGENELMLASVHDLKAKLSQREKELEARLHQMTYKNNLSGGKSTRRNQMK